MFDDFVKSRNSIEFVIPANPGSSPGQAPESSYFKTFWTPAFAGVTIQLTFYEAIMFWSFESGNLFFVSDFVLRNSDLRVSSVPSVSLW
jgi:hypothetical protein